MTLRELVEQSVIEGHQQRQEDARKAEEERIADLQRRAAEEQAYTAAARETLKYLPKNVQHAARKGEATCTAALIPLKDVERPQDYLDDQPFNTAALKGVSRRIFELLQEEHLAPQVIVTDRGLFLIKVPVQPSTAS